MIKIYHNPRCRKSREALKYLEDKGATFEVILYLQNPFTGQELSDLIKIMPPAGFLDIIALEKNARMIITDSGGLQKESFFFEKPCSTNDEYAPSNKASVISSRLFACINNIRPTRSRLSFTEF